MTAHRVDHATPVADLQDRDPTSDVEAWRLHRLVDAAFPLPLAVELATTPGLDLHALLALVDRGCPPELAARILTPLDEGRS